MHFVRYWMHHVATSYVFCYRNEENGCISHAVFYFESTVVKRNCMILYHKTFITVLFPPLQLRFHPTALFSWPVLVQRVCKACRLSPWATRTQASQLSCNTLRPPTDNRFCCLVTKCCSKVSTQRQNNLFIWQLAGIIVGQLPGNRLSCKVQLQL